LPFTKFTFHMSILFLGTFLFWKEVRNGFYFFFFPPFQHPSPCKPVSPLEVTRNYPLSPPSPFRGPPQVANRLLADPLLFFRLTSDFGKHPPLIDRFFFDYRILHTPLLGNSSFNMSSFQPQRPFGTSSFFSPAIQIEISSNPFSFQFGGPSGTHSFFCHTSILRIGEVGKQFSPLCQRLPF